MGKKKVTLDTNILISALGWKGNPRKLFDKIVEGKLELVISDDQFDELSRVLDYPKFGFTKNQKDRIKSLILEIATFVKPNEKFDVVKRDPSDNIILECAVDGGVDFVVSGDPDLLDLKEFQGIKIVKVRKFLDKYL